MLPPSLSPPSMSPQRAARLEDPAPGCHWACCPAPGRLHQGSPVGLGDSRALGHVCPPVPRGATGGSWGGGGMAHWKALSPKPCASCPAESEGRGVGASEGTPVGGGNRSPTPGGGASPPPNRRAGSVPDPLVARPRAEREKESRPESERGLPRDPASGAGGRAGEASSLSEDESACGRKSRAVKTPILVPPAAPVAPAPAPAPPDTCGKPPLPLELGGRAAAPVAPAGGPAPTGTAPASRSFPFSFFFFRVPNHPPGAIPAPTPHPPAALGTPMTWLGPAEARSRRTCSALCSDTAARATLGALSSRSPCGVAL